MSAVAAMNSLPTNEWHFSCVTSSACSQAFCKIFRYWLRPSLHMLLCFTGDVKHNLSICTKVKWHKKSISAHRILFSYSPPIVRWTEIEMVSKSRSFTKTIDAARPRISTLYTIYAAAALNFLTLWKVFWSVWVIRLSSAKCWCWHCLVILWITNMWYVLLLSKAFVMQSS